jgi:hypothetical protein
MLRTVFLLGLCVMAAVFLSSCAGVRLSDDQAQDLSGAVAGADVVLDDKLWGSLDPTSRERIALGIAGFLKGATADVDLPKPSFNPVTIAADPPKYETAGIQSARDPAPGISAGVWGMIGAGGLAALGLLRFVPGAGGMVANLAYAYIAPKVDRVTDEKAHQLYQHGAAVVDYGIQMAHVAEAASPELAAAVQAKAVELQKRLGIQSTVADLVEAAKARAAII